MPLSRQDLDAIRRVVREELALYLGRAERASDAEQLEPSDDPLMQAHVAGMLAWIRNRTPANLRRHLVAMAQYKIARDERYQGFARKRYRLRGDEPITVEEM